MVEMEGLDTQTSLFLRNQIKLIQHATLLEEPLKSITAKSHPKLDLGHHAIETYILKME